MSGVKIKKIPMKNLSPKEMAELAFDRGITRGGSGTANSATRGGGTKRGPYGQGVGKMNKGGDVKYKGPLPKSKPAKSKNQKTGATRGAGDDAEYMREAAEANKYFDGGEVRGMGKAYQGGKRGCKIR